MADQTTHAAVTSDTLAPASTADAPSATTAQPETTSSTQMEPLQSAQSPPPGPMRTDTVTALAQAQDPPSPQPPLPTMIPSSPQASAIGPSSEQVITPTKEEGETGPKLQLTLLLTSGARHPFRLDASYLAKRNVEAQGDDPYNLSVYKLKELILREWRDEWEQKPVNPSNIRLISFGRLLDDKAALRDQRFNADQSNVVHMTIKPQDFVDEDEGRAAKVSYSSQREGTEGRSPGCRCTVM